MKELVYFLKNLDNRKDQDEIEKPLRKKIKTNPPDQ